MDRIENNTSNGSSIVTGVFVGMVTFSPSRCLAVTGGYLMTPPPKKEIKPL
jgi:hypothetical protein